MPNNVIVSAQASEDIESLTSYISEIFHAPDAAAKKYNLIMNVILNVLPEHPYWQHLYEDADYYGQSVYVYNVDHYRIFHVPDEAAQTTRVIRVLHQSQNASDHLDAPSNTHKT